MPTKHDFVKIIRPGYADVGQRRLASVFVTIKYRDGRLSFVGVVGPTPGGNARGGCGQIAPIAIIKCTSGWTLEMVADLWQTWDRWHLNDCRAGTPRQEEFVRKLPDNLDYIQRCKLLEKAGLLYDNGHKYGTAWITEPVPLEVLSKITSWPESDKPLPVGWRL